MSAMNRLPLSGFREEFQEFARLMCVSEEEFRAEHDRAVTWAGDCSRDGSGMSNLLCVQLRKEDGTDEIRLVALMPTSRAELRPMMFSAGAQVAAGAKGCGPRIVSHCCECWTRKFEKGDIPASLGDLSKDPQAEEAVVVTTVAIVRSGDDLESRAISSIYRMKREGDRLLQTGPPETSERCEPTLLLLFFAGFLKVNGNRIAARKAETPSEN
jgi:hypothetical protein